MDSSFYNTDCGGSLWFSSYRFLPVATNTMQHFSPLSHSRFMNNFIHTPLPMITICFLMFAVLAIGAIYLSKLQDRLVEKHGFRNGLLLTLGAAVVGVVVLFAPLAGLANWAQNHNVAWATERVQDIYQLELSDERDGDPAFKFTHDFGKDYWEVEVTNSEPTTFDMEMRFDPKTGDPVLSFPDRPGVPQP